MVECSKQWLEARTASGSRKFAAAVHINAELEATAIAVEKQATNGSQHSQLEVLHARAQRDPKHKAMVGVLDEDWAC